VYGGNFLFGKAVMITDHATTKREIACPVHRGDNFMGVDIVSSDPEVFAMNTGILNQNPPIRASTRAYLDAHVFTPKVMALTFDDVRTESAEILEDWSRRDQMATMLVIRATVTRIFLRIFSGITISEAESDRCTRQYIRAFTESSLFHGYAPWVLGLLGTHERVRREAYFPLERHGIDLMAIDVTLFAAMFSIGTLVIRCVEDTSRFGIRYAALTHQQRRAFVFESIRLFPTVTTVHRRLTEPEEVKVRGRTLRLEPGDEIAYPFVCSNRDPAVFTDPEAMDIGRTDEARDDVLSWSKGPHSCPAKDLTILVVVAMLDTLAERYELASLRIFNPQF
jgi:cytochrome P450